MQGDFTENKPGLYVIQNVEENQWLNDKLETDRYGIYYSVKFEGAAETYLLQAKTPPKEGEKLWGHVHKSSSGKSWRFTKDKDAPSGTPNVQSDDRGDAITASMVTKLGFQGFIQAEGMLPQTETHWAQVEYMADMLYQIIKKMGKPKITSETVKEIFTERPGETHTDDIPEEPSDVREWTKLHKGEPDA